MSAARIGSSNIALATTVGARYFKLAMYPHVPTIVPHTEMTSCLPICASVSHPKTPRLLSKGDAKEHRSSVTASANEMGKFTSI